MSNPNNQSPICNICFVFWGRGLRTAEHRGPEGGGPPALGPGAAAVAVADARGGRGPRDPRRGAAPQSGRQSGAPLLPIIENIRNGWSEYVTL